jgi:cbb3-type cytochrome oxidase subunit 3
MLVLEVRRMFQVWIAALCASLFLLALVAAAFWMEGRRERRRASRGATTTPKPKDLPKAA